MSNKVRIVVAGAGYWGPNLIRNVATNPDAELVAVCDTDAKALQRVANQYPTVAQFTSLDDMLAEPNIDAVIIATPSGLHYEHTLAALQAGKHVFIEKPMTDSVGQAIELAQAAVKANCTLMVGHTFLYNNIVHDVKRRTVAGELGEVQYIYSQRLNLGRFRRDSDVLWTLAPHDVTIVNYWLESRPSQVSARGLSHVHKRRGVADVCFSILDYPDGCSAHLHMSWLDPQKTRQMVVVGDRKMLIYDDVNPNRHIQIFDKGVEWEHRGPTDDFAEFTTRLRAGDVVIPNVRLVEPLSVEIDHFVKCIRHGLDPLTDGRHGVEITAILEALTDSMQNGGHPVPVEYPELAATSWSRAAHFLKG